MLGGALRAEAAASDDLAAADGATLQIAPGHVKLPPHGDAIVARTPSAIGDARDLLAPDRVGELPLRLLETARPARVNTLASEDDREVAQIGTDTGDPIEGETCMVERIEAGCNE